MNKTIREILDGCILADPNAWKEFINRFHKLISGSVAHYMPYTEIADTVQLVYLRLTHDDYQLLRKFKGENINAFVVYLSEVSKNVSLSQTRVIRRIDFREGIGLDETIDVLDERQIPEAFYVEIESKKEIYDQINKLEESDREILILRLKGYKFKEIAEILSEPLGTVLARAKRAKEKLKKIVSKEIK
ncbi:MAG: sigma-70 family RNA polymerase sigma factor [Leptospira sp.]|jgi:RNA polymerase sigma factor (sigma-70 family)|nr:sigma-70 family RNA polymerase sigma factor [Leptospira sp.]